MKSAPLEWTCAACVWSERATAESILMRLRGAGLFKREDERDPAVLLNIAAAMAHRLTCPDCGAAGISCQPTSTDDEWDTPSRACSACGKPIPPERLELFPESELCAACQQRIDRGQSPNQHDDYCPHCGERMVVRQRGGAGVARYEMICPACRK